MAFVLYLDIWSLVLPLDAMSEVLGLKCHRGVTRGGEGEGLAPASRAGEKEGRDREQTGSGLESTEGRRGRQTGVQAVGPSESPVISASLTGFFFFFLSNIYFHVSTLFYQFLFAKYVFG